MTPIPCIYPILLFFILSSASLLSATFTIGAEPEWVDSLSPDTTATLSGSDMSSGIHYLLADYQSHVARQHTFRHYTVRILSESGVQSNSELSFLFDPSYEQLEFHYIRIIRNGKYINRLFRKDIKILQREESLEQYIYDGRITAHLFLDDVQVGDIIDYAYSIQGENPIFGGKYANTFHTQLSIPIRHYRRRLLWPTGRSLYIKNHGTSVSPTKKNYNGGVEYMWDMQDINAVLPDSDIPSWYDPYARIQLSEFASWHEVAQWASTLYRHSPSLPKNVRNKIEEIQKQHPKIENQMQAVLRFVQDDVRYLGIELGENSHRPTPPEQVFKRRFGDCKDKSLLLCVMLAGIGVKASPALVHTSYRSTIAQWHPSPEAFNHAVVQATVKGITFWFDPTISYQRGPIGSIYFPAYGKALLVDSSTTTLATVKPQGLSLARIEIQESFFIKDLNFHARLAVKTTFYGADADNIRSLLATTSKPTLEKNYLNFYATSYNGIEIAKPLSFEDDQQNNTIVVYEDYHIAKLADSSNSTLIAGFYARSMQYELAVPSTSIRTMPIGISHPRNISQTIHIHMPEEWSIKEEKTTIVDSAFHFTSSCAYKDRIVTLEYRYKSLSDALQPQGVGEYIRHIEQAKEELGYQITYNRAIASNDWHINWTLLILCGMFTVFAVLGARKLYYYEPHSPISEPSSSDFYLEGLQGWLILVGMGLVIRVVVHIASLFEFKGFFNVTLWNMLTAPGQESYDPLWAPAIIGSLFFTISLIAFGIVVSILFTQKRQSFPWLMIILLCAEFAYALIDAILLKALEVDSEPLVASSTKGVASSLYATVIWIPYLFRSRRVAATFTKKQMRVNEEGGRDVPPTPLSTWQ